MADYCGVHCKGECPDYIICPYDKSKVVEKNRQSAIRNRDRKKKSRKSAEENVEILISKAKKIPELNDEFVKDLSIPEVNTIDELKAHKEKELLEQKKGEARRNYLNKVITTIAEKSKISIPDEIIDEQVASRKKDVENRMKQSGLTLDQYLSILGQKEEDFLAQLKKDSKADFTKYLVVDKVGQVENITVSDEDLDVEMAKIADQYKMKLEDVKKALGNQLGEYRYNIRMNRVEEFLFANND